MENYVSLANILTDTLNNESGSIATAKFLTRNIYLFDPCSIVIETTTLGNTAILFWDILMDLLLDVEKESGFTAITIVKSLHNNSSILNGN